MVSKGNGNLDGELFIGGGLAFGGGDGVVGETDAAGGVSAWFDEC